MKKHKHFILQIPLLLGLFCLCCLSCNKQVFRETTTDEVNITGYLDEHPESYSLLSEILIRARASGYLGAYGTYTLFAPDNEAITKWVAANGKASLDDFRDAELDSFVRYHVIRDTVGSLRFTDGKIKTPTLFGEFLYTDVANGVFRVNKRAQIIRSNIRCGNGIIHAINEALTPPRQSLAELIAGNPRYTIFAEALRATGFYDTLYYKRGTEVPAEKRFQTAIVESDSVFQAAGIMNFEDLKQRFSKTGDPKNHSDSLWLYVAYHLSNSGNYLEDIASLSSLYTLAPKEILSTKLAGTRVLLNDDVFNGVYEPGAELNRVESDVTAVNGVLHESLQMFAIKVRQQVPVYFDLATSPELLTGLGAAYRNKSTPLVVNGESIASSISYEKMDVITIGSNTYNFSASLETKRPYANGDMLGLQMCSNNANRVKYVDFKTPYLVKGRYKVWVCYAQNGNGPQLQVIFNPGRTDEQTLPNIVFLNQSLSASGVSNLADPNADNLMLAQGYKRYMATTGDYNANGVTGGIKPKTGSEASLNVGRLAGVINVETTDRHTVRLLAIGGTCKSNAIYLDMVHFIPADDPEQIYPRFHQLPGELFYRPQ
ncbi:fasciclin domain-containing protein [Niabella aurantiaca]|uniref:fasciclin domain-containing protein n=1 Tax=Niabella aurantiaca TaxID=379900 RepID=UPI000382BE7E|nr:fasciclin domain-containing protein [Niabella aurantiaca]